MYYVIIHIYDFRSTLNPFLKLFWRHYQVYKEWPNAKFKLLTALEKYKSVSGPISFYDSTSAPEILIEYFFHSKTDLLNTKTNFRFDTSKKEKQCSLESNFHHLTLKY